MENETGDLDSEDRWSNREPCVFFRVFFFSPCRHGQEYGPWDGAEGLNISQPWVFWLGVHDFGHHVEKPVWLLYPWCPTKKNDVLVVYGFFLYGPKNTLT